MVANSTQYNFASVIDEFTALKPFPAPNGDALRAQMRARALELLAHPDIRYMPAFKILDLVAEMVNFASAIAAEPQLRAAEAKALLQSHISDSAPLITECMLDAALERARYEPMMLDAAGIDEIAYRNLTLSKRWSAMLGVHQSKAPLPEEWRLILTSAVTDAIAAQAFARYRVGPLLQLFAEMLQQARELHESAAALDQLLPHIGPQSPLWRRYALKAARYSEQPAAAKSPSALPAQARIPATPLPAKHSLH